MSFFFYVYVFAIVFINMCCILYVIRTICEKVTFVIMKSIII